MATREVKLQLYKPHELQRRFHNSKKRFRVAATGRQMGKSTMANMEMLKQAWENPNTQYAFISPVFSQAKEQFRRMIACLPLEVIARKSDTELRINLINGSIMEYLSGDNPHSLRGKTLHGVLIDEVRDQNPELWSQVIRPMISTTKGWAVFISTPAGFNSFYDLAQKAKEDPDWEFFTGPSTCNPLFTQEEFEAAKKEMSENEFKQEILADFLDLNSGSAYMNFTEENLRETSPFCQGLYSPYLPIVIGLDFNLTPMSWVIGQERAGCFYFFDEIHLKKSHTQEASLELINRLRGLQLKSKPQLILAGDATGKAGQRAAAGKSDYSILLELLDDAGFSYSNLTPESNPNVKDRVNTVNQKLCDASGSRQLFIHPTKVPYLKKDLQRVTWKQGATFTLDQTTDPMLTHMSDALGYVLCAMSNIWEPSPGGLRVLRRG